MPFPAAGEGIFIWGLSFPIDPARQGLILPEGPSGCAAKA